MGRPPAGRIGGAGPMTTTDRVARPGLVERYRAFLPVTDATPVKSLSLIHI